MKCVKQLKQNAMKTIATMIFAVVTMVATAVEKPKMHVIPVTADRAVVALTNENPARFEITMKDQDGRVVYYKKTSETSTDYRKVFDFSDLEKGTYELSFKINNTLIKRNIEIENGAIQVSDSELRFDPYFKMDGNVLKLSYLNFDENELLLSLFKNNDVVYQSFIGKEFNTLRGFDLSKLENGRYEVVLADGNNEYSYTVEKY